MSSISCADLAGAARWQGTDLILRVRVQPQASCDEFAGIHAGAIKIRLAAPPVDGKANAALIAFLADACGVAKLRVSLLKGETGPIKQRRIQAPARPSIRRIRPAEGPGLNYTLSICGESAGWVYPGSATSPILSSQVTVNSQHYGRHQ